VAKGDLVTKPVDHPKRKAPRKRKHGHDAGPREQDAPRIDGCHCHAGGGVAIGNQYGMLFHREQSPILASADGIASCGHRVGPGTERHIVWWHSGRLVCTGCRPHRPGESGGKPGESGGDQGESGGDGKLSGGDGKLSGGGLSDGKLSDGGPPVCAAELRVAFSTLPGALADAMGRDDGLPIPTSTRR
jgi:hypothetical protein